MGSDPIYQRYKMKKSIFSLVFTIGLLLTCNIAFSAKNSIKPIKTILIIVEQPYPSSITDGISKDAYLLYENPQSALTSKYEDNLDSLLLRDFEKVMWANNIDAHLGFYTPGKPANNPPDLTQYLAGSGTKWKYALWIRHLRGKIDCKKSNYPNGCEAQFQTRATIFDTANGKVMWDIDKLGNDYFNYRVWEDGRMYTHLLTRLKNDGWIELPKVEPVVK
jgi:hypothetical protein